LRSFLLIINQRHAFPVNMVQKLLFGRKFMTSPIWGYANENRSQVKIINSHTVCWKTESLQIFRINQSNYSNAVTVWCKKVLESIVFLIFRLQFTFYSNRLPVVTFGRRKFFEICRFFVLILRMQLNFRVFCM